VVEQRSPKPLAGVRFPHRPQINFMQERIEKLEKEIDIIKERNLKVEADKAWETSYFRVFSISLITYIVASRVLYFIGSENYLLDALIPTAGYFLSTQSLPFIKKWWIRNNIKK
jgi:hypothetical protein